ncbi:putative basic amino acid antiporter YfcC [Anaerotruncus sp. 80]|uniref:Putative basic amino acid antiporter YfcC n=1 Tax=Anaerotruncus colihominis TaxID=169435 RepID=A0A845QPF7_9FIRM|nr:MULTISPECIES: Na+/H+ antiporter NhaC family protein [Anaerotruncus]MCI9640586.1 putative basic amino acid antiporter YfcC [Emergencia sp.]NBH62597.1 putative basic amino acid antiporter YfcC [Anaerotruncus colihominis]NCF03252.1 putative basic amino acid antiporter YfcC [Anaerotruncus sp. 80]
METLNDKKSRVPHTYVIICGFVILMAILTYVIPAGSYSTVFNEEIRKDVIDPNSFEYVEKSPVSLLSLLTSVTLGMQGVGDVIFFVFIIGGSMEIINATGAIEHGVGTLARNKFMGKFFIPVFAFVFGLMGATFGASDELVVFAPIGVAVAHAFGYDALTGLSAVTLGAACGFNAGFLNPFSTGVAQSIAELPMYSGIELRIVVFVIMFAVTVWYIMRYAKKVKADPKASIVYGCRCETEKEDVDISQIAKMGKRDVAIMLLFVAGIIFMVYGVFNWEWYIDEMSGIFIAVGVIAGIIGGLNLNKIANTFVEGAASLTFGALVTGFAKAIVIVMEEGQIMDTIIHALSQAVIALPTGISVVGMFIVQIIVNFFIPSSTGQAATIMPIMIPLSDIVQVTRQTAVLCFQFGDGFSNSIIPTSTVLMSYLAVTKVPYNKWFKFIWPLMLIWICIGAVILIAANLINYGPF